MSAPTNAAAKADTKRGRSGGRHSSQPVASDRSVRQRIGPSTALPAFAPSAAGLRSVSSAAVTLARPSLMRLAVVERQLMMQGLDFTSLARLASTCKQLRAEAMHKEAGRFIPEPLLGSALYEACFIDRDHPAHASPLFRKHAPMSLHFRSVLNTDAAFEALMDKAATFSRIAQLGSSDNRWWTDDRVIRLLALPCIQDVRRLSLSRKWLTSPRVQSALFSLPQLQECVVSAEPAARLLPSSVTLASHLSSCVIYVDRECAASVRSVRALRLAPALASLDFSFIFDGPPHPAEPVFNELVWCLPHTLTHLSLWNLDIPRNLPRPLAKALLSRTPLLKSLEITGCVESSLRGLLDAGLRALPKLRRVAFSWVTPVHFSFDQDPDPIPPLLRRFLHRFPEVTVRFKIDKAFWEDPDQLSVMQSHYLSWPRVELYNAESRQRIGGPPSPHASDDEGGSDVEEWLDPGLDADRSEH